MAKRLKIGMVCYPTYGGSGVIAAELAKGLATRGHEIHLMSMALPVRMEAFTPRVTFHEVKEVVGWPFDHSWYDVALTNTIVRLAKETHLDLLHVHYAMPHAVSGYLAREILRSEGVRLPVITTLHGTDVTLVSDHRSFERVMRFVMTQSDGLTAVSDSLSNTTRKQIALAREVQVIPNGVDANVFRPEVPRAIRTGLCGDRGSDPLLMHVSNFRPMKRVVDVVEIFAMVRASRRATLVMVGDGPEKERAELAAKDLGVAESVRFLGKQEGVESLLPCADVFLLPSQEESFGLAALEAMACGVPVVGSRVGGLPEVVGHGREGFLEPVGDVTGMAQDCLTLLDDLSLRRRMGVAARRRAIDRFGINLMVSRYERYYRTVLKGSLRDGKKRSHEA